MTAKPNQHAPEPQEERAPATPTNAGDPPRRKRRGRRLVIILLAMFVGALGLVALLPTIASMSWARRQVLGIANDRIRGSLAVDAWSLGWFSPCSLTGVKVVDPSDREVLHVESVRYGGGLLEAITGWDHLSDLVIVEPVSTLYVSETGEISLADAFALVTPSTEKPDAGEPLDITANVELRKGSVQMHFADGRQAGLSEIDAKLDVASAGKLNANISANVEGGGRVAGDVKLNGWMKDGAFDVSSAEGEWHLAADEAVDLTIVDTLAQLGLGLGGTATLKTDGTVAGGKLRGEVSSVARGLRASTAGDRLVKPVDVNLAGTIELVGEDLATQWDVSGEFGKLNTQLACKLSALSAPQVSATLLDALLAGENRSVTLPDVTLNSSARIDLAALAQAVPSVLRVQPGVNITQGDFTIEKLAVRGGDSPNVSLAANVTGLAATNGDTVIRAEPISAAIDADSQPGRGIEVRQAAITTGFGEITAHGSPQEVSAKLSADLAELHAQLGSMFDLNVDALAGRVAGDITAKRGSADQMALNVHATGENLRYVAGDKHLDVARAELTQTGTVTLADGQVSRIDTSAASLALDDRVRVDAKGWVAPRSETFNVDAQLQQVDTAYATKLLAGIGVELAQDVSGVWRGTAQAGRGEGGAISASGELNGSAITVTERGAATAGGDRLVEPMDVTIVGKVNLVGEKLASMCDLSGAFGKISTQLNYDLTTATAADVGDDLVAALLAGEKRRMTLPTFDMQANGRVDLAVLARSVPALLRVRPGVSISQGELAIDNLAVKGGASPQVNLSAKLSELTARDGERVIRAEPITASVDVASPPDGGLEVRSANVKTGFGTLNAKGTPEEVTAQLTADLAELHAQLGSMFDFNVDQLAGRVVGSMTARRASADHVALDVRATAANLRYAAEGRDVQVVRGELAHKSALTLAGGKVSRVDDASASLDLDGKVKIDATGWYAPESETLDADLKVTQVDLAYLSQMTGGSDGNAKQMAGTLRGSVKAQRGAASSPFTSSGTLTGQGISFDNGATIPTALCQWSDASYASAGKRFSLKSLDVRSEPLEASANNVTGNLDGAGAFTGDVHVTSDLARLGSTLAGAGALEQDPGIAGKLTLDSQLRSAGKNVAFTGKANIDGFTAQTEAARTPQQVKLAYDARVDTEQESATIQVFDLESKLATAHLRGTIADVFGAPEVDINGNYRVLWKDLMPVIYAFAPGLKEQVELRGESASDVQLAGKLSADEGKSVLAGLRAKTSFGWTAADLLGVEVGQAAIPVQSANGRVDIPTTTMTAAGGSVRLGGWVDTQRTPQVLHMPGETRVLDNVQVTPELAKKLLSRFNPLFGQATKIAGSANLVTREIALPLGEGINVGGSGGGVLELENFQIAPGGVFAELLALGKLAREIYVVDVSGLNFTVKDGRIHYRDFTFRFAQDKFDLMFYGSVGFDDSIDLVVSVPVGETILEKVGMRAGVADYAKLLAGLRIDVPMVGTRQNPKLDFSKVDVKSLFDQAIKKKGEDLITGGGILDILTGGGANQQKEGTSGTTPKSGTTNTKKATPAPTPTPAPKASDDDKPRVKRKSKGSTGRRRPG
ncbi:MAG: hypothetical protein H6817_09220 [Phycisphaerales bacterium]|nr:hypothetical protein [Phycisphaerales bacterium]